MRERAENIVLSRVLSLVLRLVDVAMLCRHGQRLPARFDSIMTANQMSLYAKSIGPPTLQRGRFPN